MKIGIESYFASLSSFEQHFCTLWNFSFSRLYFSLKNRMRRCYFKTANSQQLKLFIFHCVTFLESLFRKDCGALILKQPTAVIIHFPLRDNYLISTTANCFRITCDHFRLEFERKKKGSWFLLDLITAAVNEGRWRLNTLPRWEPSWQ